MSTKTNFVNHEKLILILLIIISCKSPEEKIKDKILQNGSIFLTKTNNTKVEDITITKIDTVRQKQELTMLYVLLSQIRNNMLSDLNIAQLEWKENLDNYNSFAQYGTPSYWLNKKDESFNRYINLKEDVELLNKQIEIFSKKANNNKNKNIEGFSVNFKYKSKDKIGMVEFKEELLPFFKNGELQNVVTFKENLLKKYHCENLIHVIQ